MATGARAHTRTHPPTARTRARGLAPAGRGASGKLPGHREVDLAVSTIAAAVSQLEQDLPSNPGTPRARRVPQVHRRKARAGTNVFAPPPHTHTLVPTHVCRPPGMLRAQQLLSALEAVNTEAYQLSQAFQRVGVASQQSAEEACAPWPRPPPGPRLASADRGLTQAFPLPRLGPPPPPAGRLQLAAVAVEYRAIMPHLLGAGKTVVAGIVNEDARGKYVLLLRQAGVTNAHLLDAAKAVVVAPTDAQAKNGLDTCARDVIESMKKLLVATNALQVRRRRPSVFHPPPPHTHTLFSPSR